MDGVSRAVRPSPPLVTPLLYLDIHLGATGTGVISVGRSGRYASLGPKIAKRAL